MTIDPQGFPLDLTGSNPRNLVVNDTRTIASNDDTVFVPDGGPFYTRTLVIQSGSRTLRPNVDYKCLHLLKEASIESGLDVSGVIMITDSSISNITLSYQVIGGAYGDTVPVIRQLLENADNIEKSINWNTHVYAKPDVFEPAPHFVSGEDFSDWSAVLNGIRGVERAILLKDVAAWESAYQYLDNLISNRIGMINLGNFYTKSEVNAEIVKMALKTNVYTKAESNNRHYNKQEVDALIGDIDGNESYYTEGEINAKFIETVVADAKYGTKAEINRVDTAKADKSSVYTRAQTDDRYPLKTTVYNKDYIDATFVIKGTSYTKAETEARYALKSDAYNKVDSDKRYALKSQIISAPDLSQFMSRDESDAIYLKINTADIIYLRKTTADSLYAKHSDLHIIATLDKKFDNYYTKVNANELFATKKAVDDTYLTKTNANSLYFTKTYTNQTFVTKTGLDTEVTKLNNSIATKADTTYVDSNFYTSKVTEEKFYNKVDTDAKFSTRSYLDTYFYNRTEVNDKLRVYATTASVNTSFTGVNTKLNERLTKTETLNLVYTKAQVDTTFSTKNDVSSLSSTLNGLISKKADTTWVNSTFYNKTEINTNHYTRSDADSRYYLKTYVDANFLRTTVFNDDIKKYATNAKVDALSASTTTQLNNRYLKSEVYTKTESDSRYHKVGAIKIETTGDGTIYTQTGFSINTTHATTNQCGSVSFKLRNSDKVVLTGTYDTATEECRSEIYLGRDGSTTLYRDFFVSPTRIWHRQYGYLDSYFPNKNEVYAKTLTYSRTEMDARYLLKTQATSDYVTKKDWAANNTTVNTAISNTMTKTDITATFVSKTQLASGNYTKSESDARYYLKGWVDTNLTTLTKLGAEVSKLVTIAAYNSKIAELTNLINARITSSLAATTYATKTEVKVYATSAFLDSNYYTKSVSDGRYYTKATTDSTFVKRTVLDGLLKTINDNVNSALVKAETYKVGDIFITTNNFTGSAAVNSHHGYGTWERFGMGRTLVGYSSSSDDPANYRTMGRLFGSNTHTLKKAELPADGMMARISSYHNVREHGAGMTHYAGGKDNQGMRAVPSSESGWLGQAHNIVQPSVVVGMWKRIK